MSKGGVTGLGHVGILRQRRAEDGRVLHRRPRADADRPRAERPRRLLQRPAATRSTTSSSWRSRTRTKTNAQQISFTTGSLTDLKAIYGRIKASGCKIDRIVNHGIAFGCYFRDPEDNRIEVYWRRASTTRSPTATRSTWTSRKRSCCDLLNNMPAKERNPIQVRPGADHPAVLHAAGPQCTRRPAPLRCRTPLLPHCSDEGL